MSYLDQSSSRRPATIAAVTIIHLGIGYAIISGLAYSVIRYVDPVVPTQIYPPDGPPPPPRPMERSPAHDTRPTVVQPVIQPTDVLTQTIEVKPVIVEHVLPTETTPPEQVERHPPKADLTRAAQAGTGRTGWVTTDDYPPQPLRDGISGVVVISVQVGADGRVQGCTVTRSSGNAQLDDATCRLYARRARFQPALDADGKPVASVQTDRIRWQLPAE